ncbi:hypothetical protein PGT21_030827 [Puccinia graminis f. sp. tritici]|uniref:Uncharacterized protein n=1 Tax=Puccinia graminis f. sp. tritici TaxID=56615 RepID=A0A5B0QXP0_PUCGR|nr:hypothetical protein PGT21_030827 [Puccinia graminis f. sp. tritici]KAA1121107.1 hypothetical protein PGTUg99_013576 [Puccinia graminis f. sp. tritici]
MILKFLFLGLCFIPAGFLETVPSVLTSVEGSDEESHIDGAASLAVTEDSTHVEAVPSLERVEESSHEQILGAENSVHPFEAHDFAVNHVGNEQYSQKYAPQDPEKHHGGNQKALETHGDKALSKPLNLEEVLEIITGEEGGEMKLIPFIEDLKKYTGLKNTFTFMHDWLAPSHLKFERNIKIMMKIKFVELANINQRISGIKPLRFSIKDDQTLEDVEWVLNNYSLEELSFIPDDQLKKYGSLILRELKKEMINKRPKVIHDDQVRINRFIFRTVDFMFRNGFIKQETFQRFFEDIDVLIEARHDLEEFLEELKQYPISLGYPIVDIKKHWTWPMNDEFFRSLTKPQEDMIQLDLMHSGIYDYIHIFNLKSDSSLTAGRITTHDWDFIWNSISRNEYINMKIKKFHELKDLQSNQETKVESNLNGEVEFKEYVHMLSDIFLQTIRGRDNSGGPMDEFQLMFSGYILEIFNFIETKICKGILKETSIKWNSIQENVEDWYLVILQASRVQYLSSIEDSYHIFQDQYDPYFEDYTAEIYKNYMKEAVRIYSEFGRTYLRIKNRDDRLSEWLSQQTKIKDIFDKEGIRMIQRFAQRGNIDFKYATEDLKDILKTMKNILSS